MGVRPTQSRGGVKGGFPLAGSRGGAPLWGLGQRPNCRTGDHSQGSHQQRRRQRSVPASNFAHPQMRPQLALPTTRTLSRQMGATDQHREKWFSCCWSFLLHGFRLCGGDQRALRSPSGLLRMSISVTEFLSLHGARLRTRSKRRSRRA